MSAGIRVGMWVTALAAVWGAVAWLRPLGGLLPMTREMVVITKAILAETKDLQTGVEKVQRNVRAIQRQEKLLEEQEQLTRTILAELRQQEQLSVAATTRLQQILEAESTTVALIWRADSASAVTQQGLDANALELERLGAATGRIHSSSWAMERQLDHLLVELEGSADNFAIVERLEHAVDQAAERSGHWWDRLGEWLPWN